MLFHVNPRRTQCYGVRYKAQTFLLEHDHAGGGGEEVGGSSPKVTR
jgi:hypothetical protein